MATIRLDQLVVDLIFNGDRRELDKLDQGVKNFNKRLNNLVKPLTIVGTIGAASLGLIGKAGLSTEEALLRTRAALGFTEDQMKTLREEALRVGSRLPLNTADIVNAQQAYGKLGATFQEIIRDTPAIAGAAVATGLAPEQVARYARIIQNVFGGDVAGNLDIMLKAANNSAGAFMDFGESLQFSGQSAADAGLNFQTYIATLGGIAGAGREVQSIAPGLAAMWARLAKAEEDIGEGGQTVTGAFQGVGISMADVNDAMDGTSDGFVRLLELINNANLTATQLTALLSTLAGDTYSASISYAVQNPEAIRELINELEQAGGEVERQQEIIVSGASGGIKVMMAQIDTLLNRLAELGVLKAIQNFTKAVSALIGWLTKTNEEGELVNRRWLQMIHILATALASLLAVAAVLKVTTFALSGFVVLAKAAAWANKQFAISTTFATIANSRFVLSLKATRIGMLLTGATARVMWASITGPIGIAVALIGILVYKFRRQILGALKFAWNWIKGNWPLLVGILLGPFGIAGALIWKFRDQILGAFQDVWDWLRESPIFGPVIDGIQAIIDFVRDLPGRVVGILKDIPGMVADAIRDIPGLGAALEVFTGIAGKVGKALGFQEGGMVPGPVGRPMLATVHGGEMVLPPSAGQMLLDMFQGFRLGAAGLPTPPPGAATMYRQSMMSRPTVNMGDINITINTSPGADSTEIAENVRDAVKDVVDKAIGNTFRDIAHDFDGPIER